MAYATRGRLNDAAQALMMMLASPPAEEQAFELPAEEQAFELPAEKQAFELPAEEQALELPAVLTWGRKRKRSVGAASPAPGPPPAPAEHSGIAGNEDDAAAATAAGTSPAKAAAGEWPTLPTQSMAAAAADQGGISASGACDGGAAGVVVAPSGVAPATPQAGAHSPAASPLQQQQQQQRVPLTLQEMQEKLSMWGSLQVKLQHKQEQLRQLIQQQEQEDLLAETAQAGTGFAVTNTEQQQLQPKKDVSYSGGRAAADTAAHDAPSRFVQQQPDVGQDFGGGEDMVGAAVHGAPTCSRFVQQQPVSATYGSHRAISTSFAYDSVRVADAGTGGGGSGAAAASAVDRVEEAIMFQPSYGRASSKAAGPAPPPMEPACTTTVKETAYGLTSGLNGAVL